MLIKFLEQISLDKFLASTVKRMGLYAAEYGMLNWVAPRWMSVPLRFTTLSAVGAASKGLYWWVITPNPEASLEQSLVFEGTREELDELAFVIVTPEDSGYDLNFKAIKNKILELAETAVNESGQYVLNITLSDVIKGTGAFVGSNFASGAFIIFMGPPSLLSLPAYFLLEGTAKSVGAFCGEEISTYLCGTNEKNSLPSIEDEIESFEWLGTPPPSPIVRLYDEDRAPVIIEDYAGDEPVDKQRSLVRLR